MNQRSEQLLRLFERALLIRRTEERIIEQYAEQNRLFADKKPVVHAIKCPTHLSIGQEAAAAGVGLALDAKDVVFSTHRCHGHYLGKGGDLKRMMAELFGRSTGCSQGKGGSMHLVDPDVGMLGSSAIVAGSLPLGVGAALSFRLRNLPFVGVACFGDGAVEQGVFHECLNLASVQGLPVLFVCENNFFATLSHVESRQTIPILDRAKIYGMPCIQTTGDDLLGVYDAASELLRGIRGGHGPAFLEVQAYRWMSHVGTEFDTGKMRRTQRELDGWRARCPLHVAERQLMEMGVASTEVEAVRRRVESELETAMAFALESAEPSRDAMWDDLGARGQS